MYLSHELIEKAHGSLPDCGDMRPALRTRGRPREDLTGRDPHGLDRDEVAEPAGKEERGGSSPLPHKRNPVLSVVALANIRRVQDLSHTLQSAMIDEHERAGGAWHSECEALSDVLALTGGGLSRRVR